MEVYINDIMSTVHAVDGESLLTPQTQAKIVRAVLEAVREQEEHRMRVRAEKHISSGVRDELDEEWR
jgi:hypothetical protein